MDRIVVDPAVMGGVPCLRGTRVPVVTITGLLAEKVSIEAVLEQYPQLTVPDVNACQAFIEHLIRGRSGTPLPGLTIRELVSQLTWRVLGPLKGRAKSVLDWAGLRGEPPTTIEDAARRYFVTPNAVKHRIRRVAAAGAQLPLTDNLVAELVGPPLSGENSVTHRRCIHLLGVETRTPWGK
ncbi:MAG TPA: DUF433 domain-containing protein [Mycobacterium sp.]